MMQLGAVFDRIPRIALFAAAGLTQFALIALMVGDRVHILQTGTEVLLRTRPVDPRDFLRGDYVTLGYDISSVAAGDLEGAPYRKFVYVKIAPDPEGFYKAVSVHAEPVAVSGSEVLIRGSVDRYGACSAGQQRVFCGTIHLSYGIESYFVPEGGGKAIEQARNQSKVAIVAAVTPAGRAAIKRLTIDGQAVYDEPLF
jgi:uncharacterized membrane-anchored protein